MTSRRDENSSDQIIEWTVLGKSLRIRSTAPELTRSAMAEIESRLSSLQQEKSLSSSFDHLLLLILEMALEKQELREKGKALLKRTDHLVDCISEMTRSS
jgi:hypothetical protein